MKPLRQIAHLDPCEDAMEWLNDYDDVQQAWEESVVRPDWMTWLIVRSFATRAALVRCCCDVLRVLPEQPLTKKAVQAAEKWLEDGTTPWPSVDAEPGEEASYSTRRAVNHLVSLCHPDSPPYVSYIVTAAVSEVYVSGYSSGRVCLADANRTVGKIILKHFPAPPELPQPSPAL